MQLSYSIDQGKALEGQLADSGFHDVVTGENFAEAVPFGKFLTRDTTGDNRVKLPAAATDVTDVTKVRGLALAHQAIESSATGVPQYPIKSAVNVLRKGRAWVKAEEAVVPTDPVTVRHAAGGLGVGAFAKTADASRALLAGAKYLTTAAANALVLVEFNL